MNGATFGWGRIARLGLVQAMIGAVVVLTTSTLNRVMVVELALPALLPGMLVAFHYLVQVARPRMGHGVDVAGRHTPWILGGMGVLSVGGVLSALAVVLMAGQPAVGIALAFVGFALIGLGVSACGTALLALLAKRVEPSRRAGAATCVWLMMIVGFAVTAGVCGKLLEPYSPERLLAVSASVSAIACVVTLVALAGLEGRPGAARAAPVAAAAVPAFRVALAQVWRDAEARRFTVFVFVSMLAYSAQDLVLEPFAGTVFGFTPGQSTGLSGVQHGGVLAGMLLAAAAGKRWRGHSAGSLRVWVVSGCLLSALMLAGLAAAAAVGAGWPLKANVFLMGAANGAFSIAAIGSMMQLAGAGRAHSEGVRMGVWGAAQAVAFGLGGLIGTGASDAARWLLGDAAQAYGAVFALEAALFLLSAHLALGATRRTAAPPAPTAGDRLAWANATERS